MPTIVHFDMGADDINRARGFYQGLFGWNMSPPGSDYALIETTDAEGKPVIGGGIARRNEFNPGMTVYIGVDDIDKYAADVDKLGGSIVSPRNAVPGWGYSVLCKDTEGNLFGLWQDDKEAK